MKVIICAGPHLNPSEASRVHSELVKQGISVSIGDYAGTPGRILYNSMLSKKLLIKK